MWTAINLRARHAVVGEEKPEAEDGLREDVENGICNDFRVHIRDVTGAGNPPHARMDQYK
jgi:hypothetical protein